MASYPVTFCVDLYRNQLIMNCFHKEGGMHWIFKSAFLAIAIQPIFRCRLSTCIVEYIFKWEAAVSQWSVLLARW